MLKYLKAGNPWESFKYMALQIDTVAHACNLITREIKDYQKNLTIQYIVHHEGQRTEALGIAAQDILSHPASETAMHILQKQRRSEESMLLGTAVARQNLFFGLATRDSVLALCTINIDHFNSLKEARRQAYHLAWHAIDAAEYHANPLNRTGGSTEVMIRRRNALEMASANLRADVFSAAISSFHRDQEAPRRAALVRGLSALHTKSLYSPEYYPFVIALEATEFALSQVDPQQISKKRIVPMALRLAKEVGMTFDEITLKNWLAFAEPAQDMAWQGFSEAEILSSAINTSPNTYVRAIGYLISELAKIEPASIVSIRETYSPFADNEFNEKLHDKMIDQIYQDIIAQGLKQKSSLPFWNMANQQNQSLTEGRAIGWCASALQAAGSAYDSAKQDDAAEAERYISKEFENKRRGAGWDDLRELGKRVIRSHRQGSPVTMSDLKELSRDMEGLKSLRQSVEKTMADPHYRNKLAAADELRPAEPKPGPKTPAPALAAAPTTPAYAASTPGLGGVRKNAARQTAAVQQHQVDEEAKE